MKKLLITATLLLLLSLKPLFAGVAKGVDVREVQNILTELCFNVGPIDGVWGKKTEKAAEEFFTKYFKKYGGYLGHMELKMLEASYRAGVVSGQRIKRCPIEIKDKPLNAENKVTFNNKKKANSNEFICESGLSDVYYSRKRKVRHRVVNGATVFQGFYELPQGLRPCANDKTLNFYYSKWLGERHGQKYVVLPSSNPLQIASLAQNSEVLDRQLEFNGILSYLYYKEGKIQFDQLAPQSRFQFDLNNKTEFRSNSIGKSIVSYLIGNAICDGYINSVDETLGSWPILENTLYSELPLIDLLNMRARDQHVVTEKDGFLKTGRWFNPVSIRDAASLELENTKPNKRREYNYNGFITNVLMNYMIFKLGDNWQDFLDQVFQEKIKIGHRFIFQKAYGADRDGVGWYSAYASRYDYLRIAISMLNDWQSDNCVGKYLKQIKKRSEPMGKQFWLFDLKPKNARNNAGFASQYGGQFYFNYTGMKQRNIFGMDGYGGQSVLIDMDNSRIVVVNAASTNYDWYELVYQPIKTGKLKTN